MHEHFEEIGYGIAETLGRPAFAVLGSGLDGMAFALEDGGTLKITKSAPEAALAQMLMDGEIDAAHIFPEIEEVCTITMDDGSTAYAIVKRDCHDVFEDPDGEQVAIGIPLWKAALSLSISGVLMDEPDRVKMAAAWLSDRQDTPDLIEFANALWTLRLRDGIFPGDLPASNFGISDGRLCVRDWGGFRMNPLKQTMILERVHSLADAAPSPSLPAMAG